METMTIREIIEEATRTLEYHDFNYSLVDYGYEKAKKSARADMRYFVKVTNMLPDDLREAFRNLWTASYRYFRCFRPMWTNPDAEQRKAERDEARATLDNLIAQIA